MITIEYLNAMKVDVHQKMRDKGFWDKPRNQATAWALTIGELFEGLEADRQGKSFKLMDYTQKNMVISILNGSVLPADPSKSIHTLIKDTYIEFVRGTVDEEMADALIRMMDFCGGYDITFTGEGILTDTEVLGWPEDFGEGLLKVVRSFLRALESLQLPQSTKDGVNYHFTMAAGTLNSFCKFHGVDLVEQIRYKMAFNASRAYMHGNNRY